ncbi:MAG: D-tyrosyl-tRNA(Tyr) deacylase [Vampirovibrionales bacterium]|nr:D-tyrosyl-tRNA(Tyr) deacylase [Vampirovibrionales bacterium]
MIVVIQRVLEARVAVDGRTVGEIGRGVLALIGFEKGDDAASLDLPLKKIPHLRIFADEAGKMNRSLLDVDGALLAVSQFTLAGDCRKGLRPSFDDALPPAEAELLYDQFVARLRSDGGCRVETGVFGAAMAVHLLNDGPVTLILHS